MLSKWFRRSKPRVFLGSLVVLPRTDLKRYLEWSGTGTEVDEKLRSKLVELISLPPADQLLEPRDNDLCLDVAIPAFQSGSGALSHLGGEALPLVWRPRITVIGQLRQISTGRTHSHAKVTHKMPWSRFLAGSLNWRLIFLELTGASPAQMQALLHEACIKLLQRLRKTL